MDCTNCATGLDHCHGTLVTHSDGLAECTEAGCTDTDRPRHTLVIDCEAMTGGCVCALAPLEALRRAS
ncbi:hypothetical protein CFN78_22590 [Amycolatopsis antarctica]|uniref:Uncharacterized protein n=1 Tax=Amycolatopsis antarctica TaxID=1854586 RepID=A0A263CXS1_9PSEU|nr:hypothetical protein [Amycolatopsis antarctica]OZM70943.1 hypothetical protein CFN78_22590 [Amycolatopsis antarctica]